LPPSKQGPGLIVIQEIFGVNAAMRKICDHYASLATLLFVRSFWRQEPGVQLTDKTPAEWDRAMELFLRASMSKPVFAICLQLSHMCAR